MSELHTPLTNRKATRLAGYDYSSPGYYFITARTVRGLPAFSVVDESRTNRTSYGDLVQESWNGLPVRFDGLGTDAFTVQPDHVHGIIVIRRQTNTTLGDVVRAFKSISALAINRCLGRRDGHVWQRGYYERVIRDEHELTQVRHYVTFNGLKTLEQADISRSDQVLNSLRPFRAQQAAPLPGTAIASRGRQ